MCAILIRFRLNELATFVNPSKRGRLFTRHSIFLCDLSEPPIVLAIYNLRKRDIRTLHALKGFLSAIDLFLVDTPSDLALLGNQLRNILASHLAPRFPQPRIMIGARMLMVSEIHGRRP